MSEEMVSEFASWDRHGELSKLREELKKRQQSGISPRSLWGSSAGRSRLTTVRHDPRLQKQP
jgi:hypothetical protein